MRNTLIIAILVLSPAVVSANIPAFPMAFWGTATVGNNPAPEDSVIRVYDSTQTELGTVTVQENGVYGYTEPTKQKLVITEGIGVLTFTIQAQSINGGIETKGTSPVTHTGFVAEETLNKDLYFTLTSSNGGGSSSGGGGGGGGGSKKKSTAEPAVLGATTTVPLATTLNESELKVVLEQQLMALLLQLVTLLQERLLDLQTTNN